MRILAKLKKHLRLTVQIGFAALTNGYINGWMHGKIYTGTSKKFCVPGLNCYSCPGALGSCPIGALQAVLTDPKYRYSYYVIGILMAFGAFFGRFICGWLCPFGLVQDLLHKIPFPKKIKKIPGDHMLRYLKYAILLTLVIILPLSVRNVADIGIPWFCKWLCPSGTLFAGIPLILKNPYLQAAIGFLFNWKMGILIFIIVLSIIIYRPFCRYLCPLGAIYGCFNKVSVLRYRLDKDKCISCGQCRQACKLDLPVYDNPNSAECIRCGECTKNCPTGALVGLGHTIR